MNNTIKSNTEEHEECCQKPETELKHATEVATVVEPQYINYILVVDRHDEEFEYEQTYSFDSKKALFRYISELPTGSSYIAYELVNTYTLGDYNGRLKRHLEEIDSDEAIS